MSEHQIDGLEVLSTSRLSDRAYEMIRAAVITGDLRGGEVYSASRVGAALGISPTPAREAMLALVKEGLLDVVRNKGFRVVELTPHDLDEELEIRLLLEVPTTAKLAGQLTGETLAELRSLADDVVSAAERGRLFEFLETDRKFHLAMLSKAGNQRICDIVGHLRDLRRLYGLRYLKDWDKIAEWARDHYQILDAIASGDAAATESHIRNHLLKTRASWAAAPLEHDGFDSSDRGPAQRRGAR